MAENNVCSICLQDIIQATMLECKHCFCLKCLTDYSNKFTNETALQCPLCRKTIPIPECVVAFPNINNPCNTEAKKFKYEILHGCDICEGGVNADFRCTDCCQNMCQSCKRMHDKLMTCRGHNVVDVGIGEAAGSTDGGVSVAPVPEPEDLCPFHETTTVGFYCKDCRVGVCSRCFITDHNGHQYVDVEQDKAFQNAKQELGTLEKEIENKIRQFQEFCNSLNTRISKIVEMAETECLKIDCHIEKICQKLIQLGDELKNSVNESRDEEKAKIETLLREVKLLNENLKSTNKNTAMVKEKNSIVQVLDLIPKVKMMKTKSESQKLKVPDMRYVRFLEGCEDLTSLYHQIGRTKDFLQMVNMVGIFNLGNISNIGSSSFSSPTVCSIPTHSVYGPSHGFGSSSMLGRSQDCGTSQGFDFSPNFGSSSGFSIKSSFIQGQWKLNVERDGDSNLVISLCLLSIRDSNMESCDFEFYCKLQNKINDDNSVINRGGDNLHTGESGFEMLVVDGVFDPLTGFTDANGDFTVNCTIWSKIVNKKAKKSRRGIKY